MRIVLAALMLGLFGGAASTQDAPTGMPPGLDVIQQLMPENGILVCSRAVSVHELRTIEEKIVRDGKAFVVTKTVTVPVTKVSLFQFDLATSRVITTDGKQLPLDEVWNRLKSNSAIAVSANSSAPATAYLRALHPDTLIIIPGQPKKTP